MRNRNTVEYIGGWERIRNPDFKGGEFETFKTQVQTVRGVNVSFTLGTNTGQ